MRYVVYQVPGYQPVAYTGSLYEAQQATAPDRIVEDTYTGTAVRSHKKI